jgi:hypothetical protein
MATPPLYYFAIVTCTDALYSVAGGYLCAVIAGAFIRRAMWALMIFGEIMGLVSTILGWHIQPHWFAIALLVLFPLTVWIGSSLRARKAELVAHAA